MLLALAAALLVPSIPFIRVLVPVEQLLLLLVPAFAACALLGWWNGGRLSLALLWVAVAIYVLWQPLPGSTGYASLARGWALLLAGVFGALGLARPRQAFFPRALSSVAVAGTLAFATLVVAQAPVDRVQQTVAGELGRRVEEWDRRRSGLEGTPEWRAYVERSPETMEVMQQAADQLRQMPEPAALLFPALLGLESLAVLALAWALYQRLGRNRIGPPLGALRTFRFSDQLIWGLVVGITTLVVPTLADLRGFGINLLVFFGALYVLRGLGVLTWILAPGRLTTALLIGVALVAWPIFGAFALGLGVGDTWLDWRSRARPTS
ncbi:MAG TPA: DUF2232 domain-containing protein [Gemmatimonadaceae bacterium]|nr:DUF2232 domain-containing protein [Gemmatimonadaceae bacterium]